MHRRRTRFIGLAFAVAAVASALAHRAAATGVPVGGFLPLVGIGLTDEFKDGDSLDYDFFAAESAAVGGALLGSGGSPFFDLAILDTGANGSLLTTSAYAGFDLDGNEFDGTVVIEVGGATGTMDTVVTDPLGIYATGLANRLPGAPLALDQTKLLGQTNVSLLAMPPESELPNVLGLPFASQYATRIRNDEPQLFDHQGQTVRTPQIEFLPLGSGGQGITRRAPLTLAPSSSFNTLPLYAPDLFNIFNEIPLHENPTGHTHLNDGMASRAALFLSVDVENESEAIENANFFFDTGADVTVLSELNAARLGFDVVLDEPEFTVAVVGSGGARLEVPGFFVDEFTVEAVGGNLTATNVPVVVLNVTNPADPGNLVPGIVGMNLFSGRNLVIDPDPSLGAGNLGPHLYIGDPVTTVANWTTAAANAAWNGPLFWSTGDIPNVLTIANVRHVSGGNQTALLISDATAWEVNVSGAGPGQQMTLRIPTGIRLTTFAGANIERHGIVLIQPGGVLDVQNVDVRDGGRLTGAGSIVTGSGPIPGQVENVSGVVAPGVEIGAMTIEGRYSNGAAGTLEIEILDATGQHDRLEIDGPATLAGTLDVSISGANPFVPSIGNLFTILTASDGVAGHFETVNLPLLPSDRMWQIAYDQTDISLMVIKPGDFNGNGNVNSADLATWKSGYGTSYDGADFLVWQRNLGNRGNATAAPEPSARTMTALVAMVIAAIAPRIPRRTGRSL
jgi:hypothetical protein